MEVLKIEKDWCQKQKSVIPNMSIWTCHSECVIPSMSFRTCHSKHVIPKMSFRTCRSEHVIPYMSFRTCLSEHVIINIIISIKSRTDKRIKKTRRKMLLWREWVGESFMLNFNQIPQHAAQRRTFRDNSSVFLRSGFCIRLQIPQAGYNFLHPEEKSQ